MTHFFCFQRLIRHPVHIVCVLVASETKVFKSQRGADLFNSNSVQIEPKSFIVSLQTMFSRSIEFKKLLRRQVSCSETIFQKFQTISFSFGRGLD